MNDVTLWHCILQEVLEKFEFFPIKCRILRAAERYSKYVDEEADAGEKDSERRKLKTKVLPDSCSAQTLTRDLRAFSLSSE